MNLSVRARRLLWRLGVKDDAALLKLTRDDFKRAGSCGKKTIAEVEALQSKLRNSEEKEAIPESAIAISYDFENVPEEIFNKAKGTLSVRGTHVLQDLGIDNLKDFMRLGSQAILRCRNCGKKTADEILRIQASLVKFGVKKAREKVVQVIRTPPNFDNAPKEVFDAIKSVLSIRGVHTLEDLHVENLRTFMNMKREGLLKLRNCGRKTANEILQVQTDILNYAQDSLDKCKEFHPELLLSAPCLAGKRTNPTHANISEVIFIDIDNPALWLTNWIEDLAHSSKKAHAFMLRKGMLGFPPMTLESVGERVGGVTRERIRQIEMALEKRASTHLQQHKLRPLADAAAALVQQHGGMMNLDELTKDLLFKGENGDQFKFATELVAFLSSLRVWKDAGLVLGEGGVMRGEDSQAVTTRLLGMLEEVSSAAADEVHFDGLWSIRRERLKKALQLSYSTAYGTSKIGAISDALFDTVLNRCRKRVKAHEDRVYSLDLWRIRFGRTSQIVDTLLHQIGKPVHFTEMIKHVNMWRTDITERSVFAALDRSDNALLWDRGTYVHKNNVVIPISLIHDVEFWLIDALKEDVPFISVNGAFLHFRSRCERAGFPSEVALYTCLRKSAHRALIFPRQPFVYLRRGFTQRIPLIIALVDYLRDAGGPVSQQQFRDFGIGKMFLKEYQFSQVIQENSNVIRTKNWGYLHLDNIELDQEVVLQLIHYTQQVLSKEEHCSISKIYNDKLVTCRSAGIDSEIMLYSVFQCLAGELFILNGFPQIARANPDKETSGHSITRRVLDYVRDTRKPCTYEVLEKHFVELLRYKESTVFSIVNEPEICSYHHGCVIHFETLGWEEVKQQELERFALPVYEDAVKAGACYGRVSHLLESTMLPSLPNNFYWSNVLIADLLTRGGRYLVLGNSKEVFLPRENEHGIKNLEDLIATLLNRNWGGAANLAAFEDSLRELGIIRKRLPMMIGSGQNVVIKDGEIVLREFLASAQRS